MGTSSVKHEQPTEAIDLLCREELSGYDDSEEHPANQPPPAFKNILTNQRLQKAIEARVNKRVGTNLSENELATHLMASVGVLPQQQSGINGAGSSRNPRQIKRKVTINRKSKEDEVKIKGEWNSTQVQGKQKTGKKGRTTIGKASDYKD